MARKGRAPKRDVDPDPIYNSKLVTRSINKIMNQGKKSLAEDIFYMAMNIIAEQTNEDPVEVLQDALSNVMPALEVKSRRVGGATYQVPVEVDERRKQILGLRWLIDSARNRGERRMAERVANEILDAYNGEGNSIRRKEEMHRMAEANKAFAHYRW